MASDRELFELRNGRVIMDEDLSEKMYTTHQAQLSLRHTHPSGLVIA